METILELIRPFARRSSAQGSTRQTPDTLRGTPRNFCAATEISYSRVAVDSVSAADVGLDLTHTNETDLESLMRAANRGDSNAYGRFLRAVTPILRGIIRARGARLGPEGCEDVLQAVLLAIHLKRHTWREDLPLRPWLYAVARHKVIDALRARGAAANVPVEPFTDSVPAPPAPDALAGRDLDRLLERLGSRDSSIIRAIGIEGDSAAEAAARLGMTEGAVRVALHRALKRIARLRQTLFE